MKFIFSVLFLFLSLSASSARAQCDEETILKFVARASCAHSNDSNHCKSLSLFAGTAANAAVMASLQSDPQGKLVASYLKESQSVRETLMKDYKKVLEVYYELKKKSVNPNTFVDPMISLNPKEVASNSKVSQIGELHYSEYLEFKKQMDADPRLQNNEFLKRFNEYGMGAANDIFQRISSYTKEKFPHLSKEQSLILSMEIGMPNDGLALIESRMAFTEISAEKGYPQNRATLDPAARDRHAAKIAETEKRFAAKQGLFAKLQSQPVMSALGLGLNVGIPMASEANKHLSLNRCAQSLGAHLNEKDVIALGRLVEADGFLGGKKNCDAVTFTAEGASELVSYMGQLSPDAKQFLCKMEASLAKKQDSQTMKNSLRQAANVKACEEKIQVPTSKGNVQLVRDDRGQWIYSSIRSENPDFNDYLLGKVRLPLIPMERMKVNVNPTVLCDGRELTGSNQKAMCEMSRAMNAHSQLSSTEKIICSGAFRGGAAPAAVRSTGVK